MVTVGLGGSSAKELGEDGPHALRIRRERIEQGALCGVMLQYPSGIARVVGLHGSVSVEDVQAAAQVHQQAAGAATERFEHDHEQAGQDVGIDAVVGRGGDGFP